MKKIETTMNMIVSIMASTYIMWYVTAVINWIFKGFYEWLLVAPLNETLLTYFVTLLVWFSMTYAFYQKVEMQSE